MLLAAVDLGLASCYVSGFREKDIKGTLNLPEGVIPVAVLPIGYPDIIPSRRQKRELAESVHYEYYGNRKKAL